jgi:mRNA interferase RelE/StbE
LNASKAFLSGFKNALTFIPTRLFDVKKLAGTENAFRIRIGKIRIVYTILWKDKVILISRIGFRGRVY